MILLDSLRSRSRPPHTHLTHPVHHEVFYTIIRRSSNSRETSESRTQRMSTTRLSEPSKRRKGLPLSTTTSPKRKGSRRIDLQAEIKTKIRAYKTVRRKEQELPAGNFIARSYSEQEDLGTPRRLSEVRNMEAFLTIAFLKQPHLAENVYQVQ